MQLNESTQNNFLQKKNWDEWQPQTRLLLTKDSDKQGAKEQLL